MSKVSDLIATEVAAAEAASDRSDAPLPDHVRVTRGHDRSRERNLLLIKPKR